MALDNCRTAGSPYATDSQPDSDGADAPSAVVAAAAAYDSRLGRSKATEYCGIDAVPISSRPRCRSAPDCCTDDDRRLWRLTPRRTVAHWWAATACR